METLSPAAATLPHVLLLALIPVATTALGATVAAFRPPGAGMRSAIQHFAAGVVFSVVAVELLPDVTRVHDPLEIGWTFAAGLVLMLLVERLGKRRGGEEGQRGGSAGIDVGQLVGIGVDVTIDGLLVGIAFAAGAKEGLLLTAALAMELLSLGLAMASSLTGAGASRARTILLPTGVSCLLVVGALVGDTILRGASEHTLAGVLSFGCAALLYLVTEELLVEAHEAKETTFATSMFFAGFLLFLLLGMLEA
jgi:ZIP family zinc transporter